MTATGPLEAPTEQPSSSEPGQDGVAERRTRLIKKLDTESAQGCLPFTNEAFFEQSNPIVRSALFSVGSAKGSYDDWTPIFGLGAGNISYRGPFLSVDHETVLARLMVLARGKSLTQPVAFHVANVVRWLKLAESGPNFAKAKRILDDLGRAQLKISHRPALQRLYHLLTASQEGRPDGKFFKNYIDNLYGPHLKSLAAALEKRESFEIDLRFVTKASRHSITGRMLVNLDPMAAVFFDGINTTLIPFEVWEDLDGFGKKLLPYIASHRDGVFPIKLENYYKLQGSKSKSTYENSRRKFKFDLTKRLEVWQAKKYIEPGWEIYRGADEDWILGGNVRVGEAIRIRANETLLGVLDEVASEEDLEELGTDFIEHDDDKTVDMFDGDEAH